MQLPSKAMTRSPLYQALRAPGPASGRSTRSASRFITSGPRRVRAWRSRSGIDGDCGGACTCAPCHRYLDGSVADKLPEISDTERSMLELSEGVTD